VDTAGKLMAQAVTAALDSHRAVVRARAVVMAPNGWARPLGDAGEVITRPRGPLAIVARLKRGSVREGGSREAQAENSGRTHCRQKSNRPRGFNDLFEGQGCPKSAKSDGDMRLILASNHWVIIARPARLLATASITLAS
jgi:hypothetical protein